MMGFEFYYSVSRHLYARGYIKRVMGFSIENQRIPNCFPAELMSKTEVERFFCFCTEIVSGEYTGLAR